MASAEMRCAFQDSLAPHVALLQIVWQSAYGMKRPFQRMSRGGWAPIGFQGKDPATDLRGGGVLALRCFAYFSAHRVFRKQFLRMLKEQGARGPSNYPVATAAVNVACRLCAMLRVGEDSEGRLGVGGGAAVVLSKAEAAGLWEQIEAQSSGGGTAVAVAGAAAAKDRTAALLFPFYEVFCRLLLTVDEAFVADGGGVMAFNAVLARSFTQAALRAAFKGAGMRG